MRPASKLWLVCLFAIASLGSTAVARDTAVVIHPRDSVAANARNSIVTVTLKEAKSKEVVRKGKQLGIEFSLPNYATGTHVFNCEVRWGEKATISFKFPTDSVAVDFAEQLMAARAKALSECNCH